MKKILTGLIIFSASMGYGQQQEKPEATLELEKVVKTYTNTGGLSFDVRYYYADENAPAVYLDSVKGSCKMHGSRYWYLLDSTETIQGSEFVVVLYREDGIMYLAKPSGSTAAANPVAAMDSFLAAKDMYSARVVQEKGAKRVILDFKDSLPYKRMEYVIDSKTGFITRITNLVRSDQLLDPALQGQGGDVAGYAIVEIVFDHYRKGVPDEKVFDTSRYFKKEGDGYVALPPYDAYKIFIGTPNL